MDQVNIGECRFIRSESRQSLRPLMVCKCGREASTVVTKRLPAHCQERAAQAILRPQFREALEAFEKDHPPRVRRLNHPSAAAPAEVHAAWMEAGGVSPQEYVKDPKLGRQPADPHAGNVFEAAEQILSELGIDHDPSAPAAAPIPVTVVGGNGDALSTLAAEMGISTNELSRRLEAPADPPPHPDDPPGAHDEGPGASDVIG